MGSRKLKREPKATQVTRWCFLRVLSAPLWSGGLRLPPSRLDRPAWPSLEIRTASHPVGSPRQGALTIQSSWLSGLPAEAGGALGRASGRDAGPSLHCPALLVLCTSTPVSLDLLCPRRLCPTCLVIWSLSPSPGGLWVDAQPSLGGTALPPGLLQPPWPRPSPQVSSGGGDLRDH